MSRVDELNKLAELRDRGALTEEEFEAEKARLSGDAVGSKPTGTGPPLKASGNSRPFVLAGLGIGYLTLCVALNTTTIRVDGRRLTVRHSPLPFFGQIDLDATKIAQLYVQQAITRSSSDNSMSTNVSYALHARMEDGSRKTIARSLPDSDEGLFLEQEIEDHLGVVDRPVRGEY